MITKSSRQLSADIFYYRFVENRSFVVLARWYSLSPSRIRQRFDTHIRRLRYIQRELDLPDWNLIHFHRLYCAEWDLRLNPSPQPCQPPASGHQ